MDCNTSKKLSLPGLQDILQTCFEDVFEDKKCYVEEVFNTSSPRRMFDGKNP